MAPSTKRDYTSDDETSMESSSSTSSSSPMRVRPPPGPRNAKRTRISTGLNASNIMSTPIRGSSRSKAIDQADADQSPAPERRRTRGSFASNGKKINYDMKHHPMDNILRPKATANRTDRAAKSKSPEETPQSTYKKRHTSPIIKIRKRHVSESPNPDRRRSTRISASGEKRVTYDMTHHPMDDALRPKAMAKKSVHFADSHTQEVVETPKKSSVNKRKGSPLSVRKKHDKAPKISNNQNVAAKNTGGKAKDEALYTPDISCRQEKAKSDAEIGPKDDPPVTSIDHRHRTVARLGTETRQRDSLETSKFNHKHKETNANTNGEKAPEDARLDTTVSDILNNPFDLTPFTVWKDLEESNRCVYLLQKGAPLDTETLPLNWSIVGKTLVDEYMPEDSLTAIGGLAAIQIRYEQIRVEMQQYYEAAPEPAYEEDWRPMYMEDFDVYDLKGSSTKYWKPGDANLVPRILRAFRNAGTPPDEDDISHEEGVSGKDMVRRPENLPTPAATNTLTDQATNLSGLGIHETAEQVAMKLTRSELCGEIESLMSSEEVSNAFDEHANETSISIQGAKSNVSGDPQGIQSIPLANRMPQGRQQRQSMEDRFNGRTTERLDVTNVVAQTELEGSQSTTLAKREGLYPILQYNLRDPESRSRTVGDYVVGNSLIGRSEGELSQYAGSTTETTFAASSFTAVNSTPILDEVSVLRTDTAVTIHDLAQKNTAAAPQLLQETKIHTPKARPKTIGTTPSIPIQQPSIPFDVHEDQVGRTLIIQKLVQKHPISPGTDLPKENLATFSGDDSRGQRDMIQSLTGRPGSAHQTPDVAGYQSLFGNLIAQNPASTEGLTPSAPSLSAASPTGTAHSTHIAGSRSGTYSERVIRGRAPRTQTARPRAADWMEEVG